MENDKTEETVINEETQSKIKHLVISGGGATGLSYYGILKETNRMGLWNLEDIETMYGTSIGAILIVILSLKYDWKTIDDYLIKRPWHNVYKFTMYSVIDSYQKRGIFNIEEMEETFLPLFNGKDISIDVTLKEFYELTKVELHIFSVEINSFKIVDFCHKTYPDWRVIDAVYCSSCLPVMCSPFIKENNSYCDGGLISNYPLEHCINDGADPNEILGICRTNKKQNNELFGETSSLIDYLMLLVNKCSKNLFLSKKKIQIKNEYVIESEPTTIYNMYCFVSSSEEREKLINWGVNHIVGKQVDNSFNLI